MEKFLLWWINFWQIRKKLFLFLLLLIIGFFSFTALQINLNSDINQIFPDKEISKILISSESEKVFISINTRKSNTNNNEALKEIRNELLLKFPNQLNLITNEKDKSSLLETFYANIPFYLEKSDYSVIQKRLFSLDSILEQNHRSLFSPSADFNKEIVFKDPVGLLPLVRNKYNNTFSGFNYFAASDHKNALIFNLSNDNISELESLYEALQLIKNRYKKYEINVSFFSTSFIPIVNSMQIKQDLRLTLSFTIILVLLILIVTFRNYLLPALFILPAIFGIIFSLALLYWFRDGISGIALGAGAIVFGIVIDYSFHFFSHQEYNKSNSKTIQGIYKPLIFSAFTTIMAFYALTLTDSKILNDFGWFAGFGLIGSLLFVLLVLPVISPIKKIEKKQLKFNLTIPNKLSKYLALGILFLTIFFLFKANDVSFDSNIENLNFFPKELRDAEKNLVNFNSEKNKNIVLIVESEDKEITKEKNLTLLHFLEDLKTKNKITQYSNISLLNLPEENITQKRKKWKDFWEENKTILKNKIRIFSLKNGYNKNAFDDFLLLIDSRANFTPLITDEAALTTIFAKNDNQRWIAKSIITIEKENITEITKLLKAKNIKYIDKGEIANKMLVDIKDNFNFLLLYTGILVFLTLLLIYGRIELALITFLPMLISWIWILGISAILNIQFNFVNIIISTLIFGIGDDFAIFISDGYLKKYKVNADIIKVNLKSIFLSALTTIIALGSLIFAKHPAINSIAIISIIGMGSILIISFFLQPFLYKWLIINRTNKKLAPITLSNFTASLFSYTLFVGGSLILSILSIIASIIPYAGKVLKPLFHFLIQKTCWLIVFVAINIRTKGFGKKNLDFSNPSIIITNHQSFVDILQMLMLNPKIVLVVKDWVYYSNIFGRLIRYLDFITISNGVEKNLDRINKLINQGYSIMIFPEGKRSKSEKLGRFHKGAFLIAEKLKLDITPILLHGYGNAIKKNDFLIKRSILSYKVLPRISWNNKEKFGIGYRNRTKEIKKYFARKLSEFSEERENANYLYGNIQANIDYKGPILEWYYKIKWQLEKKNYSYYNSLIAKNATVYDLGCGYGFLSCFLYLKSEERNIIGIDYDDKKINIAKNYFMFKNLQNLRFNNKNILDVELQNPDAILLNDVLHYLDEKSQSHLLLKCFKNLNENGIILIREGEKSNNKHIFTKLTEFFSTKVLKFNKTENNLTFISKSYIADLAKKFDFTVETINHSNITSNHLFILKRS